MKKMVKRTVTVPIELEVFEFTHEELLNLRSYFRGGNALNDTVELLRHVAKNLPADVPFKGAKAALLERAIFLEGGMKQLDAMIWPKEEG